MVRAELGRDREDAGLKRVKDVPSSNIQLLWLLLHYGVIKVQPVDRHLQSASWLHKLYNDFLLLLGYFYLTEQIVCCDKSYLSKTDSNDMWLQRFFSTALQAVSFLLPCAQGSSVQHTETAPIPHPLPSWNNETSNLTDVNTVNQKTISGT